MVRLTLLALFILISPLILAQSAYDKIVVKAEGYYDKGDYVKAIKYNEKLKKKADKKFGAINSYTPVYYLHNAKYAIARGMMSEFETQIALAIESGKQVYGDESYGHASMLSETSELFIMYGNFVKAEAYLDEASNILEINNLYDDDIRAKINLNYAHIYSGMGFYSKALKFIESIEEYYMGRAVRQESIVNEKTGKLESRKLSDSEAKERFEEYADLLNLYAITLHHQGNLREADQAYGKAEVWIEKNLGKNNIKYVENQYYFANMLVDGGIQNDQPEDMYKRALRLFKGDYVESHYMGLMLYEKLLKSYLYDNDRTKYKNLRNEYERVVKKYFPKSVGSMFRIDLETLVFDRKLARTEENKNIEGQVAAILSTNIALPPYHQKRIDLLEFAYLTTIVQKNYGNSERYLVQAADISKELYGDASPIYHLSKIKLANYLQQYTNRNHEALQIYEESFYGIVKKQIEYAHVDYIDILNNLSHLYEELDDYEKASATLDEGLEATRKKFDDQDYEYGIELEKIAGLQLRIGEYSNAEENIDRALAILENERRDEENVVYYITALETRAQLDAIYGDFGAAESNLEASEKLLKRSKNIYFDELSTRDEKAALDLLLGKYSSTEKDLTELEAEKIELYGPTSPRLVNTYNTQAKLKLISGDYTVAEQLARKANKFAIEAYGEKSTKRAPSLIVLSEVFTTIGDYEKAEENIMLALQIQQERFGVEHIDVAKSISQLALIKFYKGDNRDEVESLFDEANRIIVENLSNRSPAYAETLMELAVLYIAQERWDDAFNTLDLAETIWKLKLDTKNSINIANIYILEGDVHYQKKDYIKAQESYLDAQRLYKRIFNSDHPEYVKVLSKLSKVYYMQGDRRSAKTAIEETLLNYDNFIKEYFPALSEREKAKFWNTIRPDYEFYNTLAFQFIDEDPKVIENVYNNALNTKALLLNSSIKIRERILNSNNYDLITKYNDWLTKKEQLTTALSMGIEQLSANEIDVGSLKNEVEQLEKQISADSEDFASALEDRKITWEEVEETLSDNEVAIEMIRYRHFDHDFTDSIIYASLYVTSDTKKRPNYFLINNGHDLETRYFQFYKNAIYYEVDDPYSYDNFWKPIADAVGSTSTIYLSADGVYNQINLEAIPVGDQKYVIDNSNIVLISNTKDLYIRANSPASTKPANDAMMFGNPTFYASADNNGRIQQLPGTEKEIDELYKMLQSNGWSADEYLENEATEDMVKELNSPKVFHIATHGFFKSDEDFTRNANELTQSEAQSVQNPLLRTGLLLKGAGDILAASSYNYNTESGILTAYEAMNLNLDQTDLVVLSACETGLGDVQAGEGVFGLQRAFLVAGAKTLIMSIFKVNDEATQELMVNFYDKWLATGKKRESFIEAKKELRNNPKFASPRYWGAFLMLGLD